MTSTLLGWAGSLLAMSVSVPQLARKDGRVSPWVYRLLLGVHGLYGAAGVSGGHWWLACSSAWGLLVAAAVLYRLRGRE